MPPPQARPGGHLFFLEPCYAAATPQLLSAHATCICTSLLRSNMLAPRLAPAHLKSNAAGMMALAYQVGLRRAWLALVGLTALWQGWQRAFQPLLLCLQPDCACTAGSRTCDVAHLLIPSGVTPQVAHFVGLACATLLVFLLYGKIGVE